MDNKPHTPRFIHPFATTVPRIAPASPAAAVLYQTLGLAVSSGLRVHNLFTIMKGADEFHEGTCRWNKWVVG